MKKFLALACSAAVLATVAGCSPENASPSVSPSPSTSSSSSSSSSSPTVTATSPAPSPSASSAVADGFPEALIPVFSGSEPTASSYEAEGGLLTASLTASSPASPEEILAFYTKHFEGLGFKALEGDAVDSTPAKDFARTTESETETVNVSVITRDGNSIYTVGANVLPGTAETAG